MKKCVICGAEFEPPRNSRTTAKYCSKRCKRDAENIRRAEKRIPLPPKKCSTCNELFNPRVKSQLTCNQTCYKIHVSNKQKEKYWANRKPNNKKCKECGKSFKANTNGKFCSLECRNIHFKTKEKTQPYYVKAREEALLRKINRPKKVCPQCNKTFTDTSKTNNMIYCNRSCFMKKPSFVIRRRISGSMRQSLRNKNGDGKSFNKLGYTVEELHRHLESQFTDGMSWDNMDEWHIDHIRPVASFNFTTVECEDFKKCWALNNLQPLWAKDNMSKGNKWDGVINA